MICDRFLGPFVGSRIPGLCKVLYGPYHRESWFPVQVLKVSLSLSFPEMFVQNHNSNDLKALQFQHWGRHIVSCNQCQFDSQWKSNEKILHKRTYLKIRLEEMKIDKYSELCSKNLKSLSQK